MTKKKSLHLQPFPNAVGPERTDAPVHFLHIPKTAGSTLSAFLQTLFLDSEFWHRGGNKNWVDLLKLTPEDLRHSQIINGHFAGYLFKHYPLPLRYFTFLRDPLARAVSHHEHVLRNEPHYYHKLARELGTFGAYLRDERTQPTVANFQLRSLAATFDPAAIASTLTSAQIAEHELERRLDTMQLDQPIEDLLRTAQARLDQMCFVGLTERFQQSLGLLCEVFGWPRPAGIESRNINPRGRSVKDLPNKDLRLLKQLNEADIDLYQLAKTRFERDWARSRFVYPQLHAFVSHAQNAEDVLLYRALRDIRQGVYVDVGANDPSGDSVTKAFYDRGWHGINIEPVPSLYEALVKQRPNDVNVNAAAGETTIRKTLYEVPGTGLSTLDPNVADRHRTQGFKVRETRVQVRTLRSILADTPRPHIHFLKIDVEGWEREVLQGIDLTATRPWIIVVEATEPNTEIPSHYGWEPLILEQGYSFVFFDGLNRYYVARERPTLKKAFSCPVNSGDGFIKASEASAVRALRDAQWSLRRQGVVLREQEDSLSKFKTSTRLAEAYAKALERERDGLKEEITVHVNGRATERVEAIQQIEALTQWATSADTYAKSLLKECENLRAALITANDARGTERVEALRQIEALTQWATSADTYGKSLLSECENLRAASEAVDDRRKAEHTDAIRQIGEIAERLASADTYSKTLASECESLRADLKTAEGTRETESLAAIRQVEEMTERAATAEAYAKTLASECDSLRAALKAAEGTREAERVAAIRQAKETAERAASADAYARSVASECESLRSALKAAHEEREAERIEAVRQIEETVNRADLAGEHVKVLETELAHWREIWQRETDARDAEVESSRQKIQELTASATSADEYAKSLFGERTNLQEILRKEREARALDQADARARIDKLQLGIATLESELAKTVAMEAELRSTLQREQAERSATNLAWSDERDKLEANAKALAERLQRAETKADALGSQIDALLETQARSEAEWQVLRKSLTESLVALERSLADLGRHWAVRLLVNKRYFSRTREH